MPEWVFLVLSLAGMGMGVLGMVGFYRLVSRGLERRHELRLSETGGGPSREVEMLRARLEALEEATYRLQDLEERVDFAERILAKQSDREQLPPVN